ncbi:MAG: oligoendopeptidase pepF/M3 family [Acidimicrobiales bacterium]|nr:oligoendopeptidase pepF/M3 family [Acidimicrobiales bacterium]
MTVTDERSIDPNDLAAMGVHWDLQPLLDGAADVDALLDEADAIADELVAAGRGRIAEMSAAELGAFYSRYAALLEVSGRAGSYAGLIFAADTSRPENGALMAHVQERSTAMSTKLIFIDLEWAAATDEHVDAVLADPAHALDFVRHHLRSERRYKDHVLTEPEERVLTEKSVTGSSAWGRLFDELSSAMEVQLPGADGTSAAVPLMQGLAMLQHPDRAVRQQAHEAVTEGLQPGLRTRAFIFNTLLNDKSVDDRLRGYPSWISSRNLANEASDESVQALVDSVVARYDIPQRWYTLKAKILGVDRIADYDRMASVATAESQVPWSVATEVVTDAYSSFSGELAGIVQRFLREEWIDAPASPGKRGGAFCAYTVPSHHPYVLLNWTGKTRDVATLAHELGHGVHGYLSREQGVFQMSTPLTLAETASVFGETVTSKRLLSTLTDPNERLALLAATLEDSIATVFRQIAMNRFEHAAHTARRTEGELAVERFNELWEETQTAMLGPSVEITEGYRSWWSYIPHFMHTPGYVYAYAYGQLLALSVYKRYEEVGEEFVPRYLDLLRAGGSMSPEDLGRIVDCDLADPAFWDGGLAIVDEQLTAAEEAAAAAGRG